MIDKFEVWLIITALLICLDFYCIFSLVIGRILRERKMDDADKQKNILVDAATGKNSDSRFKVGILNYFIVSKAIQLNSTIKENIDRTVNMNKFEKKYMKNIRSISKVKKIEAALYLGTIGTEKSRNALETALEKEMNSTVKLYIANGLADIGNEYSLGVLISSLLNENRFYRDKVNMLISDFGERFYNYLPNIERNYRIEIKELIVDFSSVYFSEVLKDYLLKLVDTQDEEISKLSKKYGVGEEKSCKSCMFCSPTDEQNMIYCKYKGNVSASFLCRKYNILPVSVSSDFAYRKLVLKACNILADYYPKELDNERYLSSKYPEIKAISVRALANFYSRDKIAKLIIFLRHEDVSREAVNAISKLTENNPVYFKEVTDAFLKEKDQEVKKLLAKILSIRIEYFIMKLTRGRHEDSEKIIKEILLLGRTSEVIDFLGKNKDINLENELISIIKKTIEESDFVKAEFEKYLDARLAAKCEIINSEKTLEKKDIKKDRILNSQLLFLLLASILVVPLIYITRHLDILFETPLLDQLKMFVIDFNYYIAFYAMTVNLIYLLLLLLSYISVKKQERLWKIKNLPFLFKRKILPSISIIAPAFNEEKTIIESANSLLNLKYPEYELIIVNDGSKDNTLNTLIRYFDLKRVDYIFHSKIETKEIRGIYLNRSRPKLVVVDKVNGGKADSLNVGINIANKEYVCGIDADSLLEDDALIKLASLTLDEETETPALGGNILPINGCTVEHGQIIEKRVAKNRLARLQTIEYIRSFMSGRLGWSFINSLLIISGAFGLFRKERVINVGGYLTSSGRYKKDTVGEDMELVVRISRQMRESKKKFRILYAYNANCWTEVPEDIKTLKKQRYRWHRGLIEILIYHKKMFLNPSYGRIGTIAMPYFWLFEMLGPIFEMQGYIMVIVSIILGLINFQIAIILFVSVILMGILVSVSSLLISEKNGHYFTIKELLILVAYAFLENFGIRQYFSLWRFTGYINMFRKPAGWQKAERKGFAGK